jgi:hypothetical protein
MYLESQRYVLSKEECEKEYIVIGKPKRYMKKKYIGGEIPIQFIRLRFCCS